MPILLFLLGFSFHFLITPKVFGVPLRVGISDLIIALTAIMLFNSWFKSPRKIDLRQLKKIFVWPLAMLAILIISYLHSGIHNDAPGRWALMKIIGFVVLIFYYGVAYWTIPSLGYDKARYTILGFIVGAWIVSLYGMYEYFGIFYLNKWSIWNPRITGVAENPNAYGILLASAAVIQFHFKELHRYINTKIAFSGLVLVMLAIILSASRSAYLGLVLAFLVCLILKTIEWRFFLKIVLATILIFILFILTPPYLLPKKLGLHLPNNKVYIVTRNQTDTGIQSRISLVKDSLQMWKDNPVLGAGLGAFWRKEITDKGEKKAYANHNTFLWIASEMGLLGLVVFSAALVSLFIQLKKHIGKEDIANLAMALTFVILGSSIGTEVLYQRYFWFFIALGLAFLKLLNKKNE